MKLIRYQVTNFRSIMDSGWIDCDDVTTLIGVNEAGKSNLLLALWKLNPAQGGAINPLQDMPRRHYSEWRDAAKKPVFINTLFELSPEVVAQVVKLSNAIPANARFVEISRDFSGQRFVYFPDATTASGIPAKLVTDIIAATMEQLSAAVEMGKGEAGIKDKSEAVLAEAKSLVEGAQNTAGRIYEKTLSEAVQHFSGVTSSGLKGSTIAPLMLQTKQKLEGLKTALNKPAPHSIEDVRKLIVAKLPSFVYYSNYGNLDSEIYLPHVIKNLSRTDLSGTTEAKTRTLRVLFDFVGLDPKEILALGNEVKPEQYQEITEKQIQDVAEKKKERDVLLQSASSLLTRKFREWWKQGDYTFRFAADGSHFRIWVSDNLRPDEIELENRSTGLQWFLSFYLVFLVESRDAHEGAILRWSSNCGQNRVLSFERHERQPPTYQTSAL